VSAVMCCSVCRNGGDGSAGEGDPQGGVPNAPLAGESTVGPVDESAIESAHNAAAPPAPVAAEEAPPPHRTRAPLRDGQPAPTYVPCLDGWSILK